MISGPFSTSYIIILLLSFTIVGLFIYLISPFIMVIFWSALLAFLLYPLYRKIRQALKNRSTLSALITIVIFVLFVLVPLSFLGVQFYLQLEGLIQRLDEETIKSLIDQITALRDKFLFSSFYPHVEPYLKELQKQLPTSVSKIAERVFHVLSGMIATGLGFILKLAFTLFALFYFLVDGERIIRALKELLPTSEARKDLIIQKISLIIHGVIFGNLLTALIQGLLALTIYYFFGIPQYVLFAFLTVLASFLPLFGTGFVWFPITIGLIIAGSYLKALIFFIICALTIAQVDNLLKPLLIGGKTKIHNLLMFLSVLGGISKFGITGIFLGPIILGLFLSIIEIYKSHLLDMNSSKSDSEVKADA